MLIIIYFPFFFFFFIFTFHWVPSLHSHSATLQSPRISWMGASTHTWCPSFYIWCWFSQLPPREHFLIAWLWSPWACVSGSHGTVTIKDSILGRLPPPGHCTDSWLKHILSLSEKEACLHIQKLWPVGQASGLVLLQGTMERVSGNGGQWTQSLFSLSASLQLTRIFQKGAYTLRWCPNFSGYCQGTLLYHLNASTNNKTIGQQTQRLS